MRLPRHDTPLSLPAEPPEEAISLDEALLDQLQPGDPPRVRWWVAASPAVVVGLGLRHRLASVVDVERCRLAKVDVLERRAGGGALLLDQHMLCGAICVSASAAPSDVTESYRWLGEELVHRLRAVGVTAAHRVEVAEARRDIAALRAASEVTSRLLLATCYGGLSPHEVVVGGAKLVGLAQIRRRNAVLFQFGVLFRDQSGLADYLVVPDEAAREQLRAELSKRTVGLESLITPRSISEAASAIAGATPFER